MYHPLEVVLRRSGNHAHKAASAFSILDLLYGKAFVVGTNSVHVEVLISWRVIVLGRRCRIIKLSVTDKKKSSIRVCLKVEHMKPLFSRLKFNNTLIREDLKDPPPSILAIVLNVVFLGKAVKGENIGDAVRIEVDTHVSKFGLLGSEQSCFVAVDPDGLIGGKNIHHVGWITEEIDSRLTVKEYKILVDGLIVALNWFVRELSQDDYAGRITSLGGVVSIHCMNLRRRRCQIRTDHGGMAIAAAIFAANSQDVLGGGRDRRGLA
jgi:hypothetical protein